MGLMWLMGKISEERDKAMLEDYGPTLTCVRCGTVVSSEVCPVCGAYTGLIKLEESFDLPVYSGRDCSEYKGTEMEKEMRYLADRYLLSCSVALMLLAFGIVAIVRGNEVVTGVIVLVIGLALSCFLVFMIKTCNVVPRFRNWRLYHKILKRGRVIDAEYMGFTGTRVKARINYKGKQQYIIVKCNDFDRLQYARSGRLHLLMIDDGYFVLDGFPAELV